MQVNQTQCYGSYNTYLNKSSSFENFLEITKELRKNIALDPLYNKQEFLIRLNEYILHDIHKKTGWKIPDNFNLFSEQKDC